MAKSMLILFLLVVAISHQGGADLDQDKSKCGMQLMGVATCLPYVGGEAKAPTMDCCDGLKQVLKQSMKCLCLIIKYRDDPRLGLKINGTLAATLPNTCHIPANVSSCIDILHLSPNSTDAKIFKESANIDGAKTNSTSAAVTSSGSSTATGSKNGTSNDAVKVGGNGKWRSTSCSTSSLSLILGSLIIVWTFTSFIFG